MTHRREDPESMLGKFYYKLTMWEVTCRLEADWRIVPRHGDGIFNRYVAQLRHLTPLVATHQTDVVQPASG